MELDYYLGLLLGGLTRGSIYALLALGYTMVYGVLKLINFAHGEIYMIGAFTALTAGILFSSLHLPPWIVFFLSIITAVIWAAAWGYTAEKIAYRPLRLAPRLSPLISAIGLSLFLQNYVLLSQTPDFLPFRSLAPEIQFLAPYKKILTSNQFIILVTSFSAMAALSWLIQKTAVGRAMRAVQQDKTMASLVGVNVDKIISFTFILGSSLAAVGGVLISSSIGQINFYIGFTAGMKAFVAAVLGGIGSISGAVLGSFVLGLTESFGCGFISSDYEDAFAFVILILILIFKPGGLLGKTRRDKV